MGGILQVDTIQNNNATTLITQTNTTTLTFGVTGQNIVIPTGVTFDTTSATVTLPSTINATTINVTTVVLAAGAVGTPSLTTSGDTNTGIFFPAADTIAFTEGGTEAMRIDSSGNVGIGETSVASKLHIKSDGSVNACARMNNTEAGTGSSNTVIFQRNGTNIGFITATGTATGYVTSSDYRLKENVVYNLNGIERIKLLKPARFNFIVEPNKIVDGFIAHEVSDIVPEAIHGTKDQIDSEGKPVHQGIDQSKIVPLLTGALQEAIARIEQLEARLTALENN